MYVKSSAYAPRKRNATLAELAARPESSATWRTLKRSAEQARAARRGRQPERRAVVGSGAGGGGRRLADQRGAEVVRGERRAHG